MNACVDLVEQSDGKHLHMLPSVAQMNHFRACWQINRLVHRRKGTHQVACKDLAVDAADRLEDGVHQIHHWQFVFGACLQRAANDVSALLHGRGLSSPREHREPLRCTLQKRPAHSDGPHSTGHAVILPFFSIFFFSSFFFLFFSNLKCMKIRYLRKVVFERDDDNMCVGGLAAGDGSEIVNEGFAVECEFEKRLREAQARALLGRRRIGHVAARHTLSFLRLPPEMDV